jgi:hypothetical protein
MGLSKSYTGVMGPRDEHNRKGWMVHILYTLFMISVKDASGSFITRILGWIAIVG